TAILDSTVDELEHRGWNVTRSAEGDVAAGRLPDADLYVNMCQGPAASERLLTLVSPEALAVNPPHSVLNCHRHQLVTHMAADGCFFSWYAADPSTVDISEESLKALVFAAARAVGLEVFGGDVAFPAPDAPVLIDLNDWPSFAPVRAAAAAAIAAYIDEKASNGTQA